jgi:hypothetical protein
VVPYDVEVLERAVRAHPDAALLRARLRVADTD